MRISDWSSDVCSSDLRGEFILSGLRNRDLRDLLFPKRASDEQERRRASQVTRKLALLRAHGLLRKISGTHRYMLTEKGRRLITALLAARQIGRASCRERVCTCV